MKGQLQCTCSRCAREKGDRESNAGWWEMKPRGPHRRTTHWFCPACAPGLLVAADGVLEGPSFKSQRVVAAALVDRVAQFLEGVDRRRTAVPARSVLFAQDVNTLRRIVAELRAIVPHPSETVMVVAAPAPAARQG